MTPKPYTVEFSDSPAVVADRLELFADWLEKQDAKTEYAHPDCTIVKDLRRYAGEIRKAVEK